MKHLPNILTLCNLVCGCIAVSYILGAHPHIITTTTEDFYPIMGTEQLVLGSIFIFIAAIFDVFDGLAARTLNAHSDIGKDLDSLADIVSFGVAPAMILYQVLWFTFMSEPKALEVSPLVTLPAFILPCFTALRLAKFNQTNIAQKAWFIGMPSPAAGLMVAVLPLILSFDNPSIAAFFQNKWVLYGLIAVLCWLMHSRSRFLKWKSPGTGLAAFLPQIIILFVGIIGYFLIGYSAFFLAFVVYILISIFYKYPNNEKVVLVES